MIEIDLQNIPNQEFTKEINGVRYAFRLHTYDDILFVDIAADDESLKRGVRACPNTPLIPYNYKTRGGNFLFYCLKNEYPHYLKFGVTQQLVYLTDAEIAQIKELSDNDT